jgi:pimeloyl-ACP methyl ester carboxylesterase
MYEHKISMATLGGHGVGAKVALAAACHHFDRVTGYFGFDSTPMNQFYHESYREVRQYLTFLESLNIKRGFSAINSDLKNNILCPKWRSLFQNNLVKAPEGGYGWNFNFDVVNRNLARDTPSNLTGWATNVGLYPGRANFIFPEHSRYVHLGTNTLPIYKVCPRLDGFNQDIFSIQGDDNPLSSYCLMQVIGFMRGKTISTRSLTDWVNS